MQASFVEAITKILVLNRVLIVNIENKTPSNFLFLLINIKNLTNAVNIKTVDLLFNKRCINNF